jgi:hypothetical protein
MDIRVTFAPSYNNDNTILTIGFGMLHVNTELGAVINVPVKLKKFASNGEERVDIQNPLYNKEKDPTKKSDYRVSSLTVHTSKGFQDKLDKVLSVKSFMDMLRVAKTEKKSVTFTWDKKAWTRTDIVVEQDELVAEAAEIALSKSTNKGGTPQATIDKGSMLEDLKKKMMTK